MFSPAKQNRIFQDVVGQIQENILSGKLKTGETLPAERELREMFHVSRGTVREALRVLEQKGLIEIKLGMGGGSVVRSASIDKVSESLALLIKSRKVPLAQLAEFRAGMEGDIAALAAQRAGRADIEKLESLLEEGRKFMEKGPGFVDEFILVDRDIHLLLAGITRNPVYEFVERTIQENIINYYDLFLSMQGRELVENFEDLKRIVGAVKEGRRNDARSLARKHVNRFNNYMEKEVK